MNAGMAPPTWTGFVPLGIYLLALGVVHLRRRPLAISGPLDSVALAGGLVGLLLIGPIPLLEPAVDAGPWGWVLLVIVGLTVLAVGVLASRPRLVVYNVSLEQMRPIVAEVVLGLDPSTRWAGDTAALPSRGIQVHVERGAMRSVSLVAIGPRPSPEAWGEFCRRLRRAVGGLRVRSSPWTGLFILLGVCLLSAAIWTALS
jgi:uncharacterized membrane protein